MRWLSCLALALVAVVGTAQAVHIHGDWLPHSQHEFHSAALDAQNMGGEEHCPLCVAMHTALPAEFRLAPLPTVEPVAISTELAVPTVVARWHFAMFSRPPPALRSL